MCLAVPGLKVVSAVRFCRILVVSTLSAAARSLLCARNVHSRGFRYVCRRDASIRFAFFLVGLKP